jgi:hypothetical protein
MEKAFFVYEAVNKRLGRPVVANTLRETGQNSVVETTSPDGLVTMVCCSGS